MRSEEAAGYSKEGRAAAIALRRNHLKLASDYCRSRKSPTSTIADSSTSSSNFPLVLKSILKTNNRRELSQETDQKLPQKPDKVVSLILITICKKKGQLVDALLKNEIIEFCFQITRVVSLGTPI